MKRFYDTAAVHAADNGWNVALDGRAIHTPAGAAQIVPSHALAEAMADEWNAQPETIVSTTLPLRDLADFAIDAVAPDRNSRALALVAYAETDTLCYRADPDDALFARQQTCWEPILGAIEARYDLVFTRVSGIIHQPQPQATRDALLARLEAEEPFVLAALTMLSSLAASLTLALSALEPDADIEALWDAACLEEDWQAQLWGRDDEAARNRATRFEAFGTAARFAQLARA